MRILDLAINDLKQLFRDWKILLFMVAMPVGFTLFMGFAYQGAVTPEDPRLVLGVAMEDGTGLLAEQLTDLLEASPDLQITMLPSDKVNQVLEDGEAVGVLIIPSGFSEQIMAGEGGQLKLVTDAASTTGQALFQLVRAPVLKLFSTAEISRFVAQNTGNEIPGGASTIFIRALEGWLETDNSSKVQLVKVQREAQNEPLGGNPYNQTSPGIILQFAVFGLITSAQILVLERRSKTLQRLMTTAMQPWEIIAGHFTAMVILVLLQIGLLVAFGQAALGVKYMSAPTGTMLVSLGLALWAASLGLFIGVISKSEEQVIVYALVAMFFFTAMGGAWFPLEGSGQWFYTIGKLTPGAWAMEGYQNILIRGLGSGSALVPSGILVAYALGFFVLAVWRFRAER